MSGLLWLYNSPRVEVCSTEERVPHAPTRHNTDYVSWLWRARASACGCPGAVLESVGYH